MRRFFLKLRRRRTLERELEAELAFHREMAASGGNAVPLGNLTLIKEVSGDPWRFTLIENLWRDVLYSMRGLSSNPAPVAIAIASLALGIGSTTAIFSLVNAMLLKPLPVHEPDRFVVAINATGVNHNGEPIGGPIGSPVKYLHFKAQTDVLQYVSALVGGMLNFSNGDLVEQVSYGRVSADFFKALDIPLVRGRGFTEAEDSPGGPRVTLISDELWATRFASDRQILGKTILLNGEPHTIIGVVAYVPAWREWGPVPAVFLPFQFDPDTTDQGNHGFIVFARLKDGVTLKQARAELQASTSSFREKFPRSMAPTDLFSVMPYKEFLIGDTRPLLWVLLSAVGLVLLISSANVANLLLVRASGRRREIAIQSAIGAGRGQVIRQLLIESVLLSLAGGLLGSLLGFAGIRGLLAVNSAGLNRIGENGVAVGIDWRLLAFALAISLFTGILFGLLPALQGSRVDLSTVLKESSGRSGTAFRQNKVRAILVVSEVGLAALLLVAAALLIRSFVALYAVNPGFQTQNVLTAKTLMTGPKYQKTAGAADAVRQELARIQGLPGVLAAATAYYVPLQGGTALPFNIPGRPIVPGRFTGAASWSPISPGFFESLNIPVKRGRAFNDRDDDKSPPVAIIDERLAKLYWQDQDPLKDRIVIGGGMIHEFQDEPTRQIIGIVGGVRSGTLSREPVQTVYVPQSQLSDAANAFVAKGGPIAYLVRTQGDPLRLAPAIQDQLRQVTGLPVSDIRSMDQVVSLSIARQRFNLLLMTVFGSAALLLAAIGIYGLMAHSVEQRTREIGIRLALGAEVRLVRRRVIFEGIRLAVIGVALGIPLAFGLTRFLAGFLYGVQPRDPLVFIVVPILLGAVACFATWFPASRASRIDPVEALRYE